MQNVYPELQLMFAIPNGGTRNIREAVKLKRTGVRRGVPDIFLAVPKGKFHGLWIETKSDKGEQTIAQIEFMAQLKNQNYYCVVCRNPVEMIEITKKYLGLL
jgi:hypothetical protein